MKTEFEESEKVIDKAIDCGRFKTNLHSSFHTNIAFCTCCYIKRPVHFYYNLSLDFVEKIC